MIHFIDILEDINLIIFGSACNRFFKQSYTVHPTSAFINCILETRGGRQRSRLGAKQKKYEGCG